MQIVGFPMGRLICGDGKSMTYEEAIKHFKGKFLLNIISGYKLRLLVILLFIRFFAYIQNSFICKNRV